MAISYFQNFEFLIPKFSKTDIFWKPYKKQKVFWIFKKPEYMLWRLVFAMPMPNFEAIRQFVVPKSPKKTRKTCIQSKFWIAIFGSSRPSTKIKIPPLNSPSKTESDKYQFCFKRSNSKFDLVWPDLTCPQPELHAIMIQII